MKLLFSSYSSSLLIFSILFIVVFRISNVSPKETSWDVLGYYLPLPATFIYEDPLMEDRAWIEKINKEKDLTGTLYQISTNDSGEPIYFFLLGMALLFLPFFLLGHGYAYIMDYPMDGFSMPYQYALVVGGLVYTGIGLIYLRKILLYYFPDKLTALLLFIIVFGTNYTHHLTLKNLETINLLFMFMTLTIWNTIKWHQKQKLVNLIGIGVSITLSSLVKPSEILLVLIPLLWNVHSFDTLKSKLNLLKTNIKQLTFAMLICIVIGLPQMSYWWIRTGHLFYDSYKNPGVGLDIFSPYFMEVLFSYKKGWLLYTPVMILGLLGFYFLLKKQKKISLALGVYFLVAFYIISSWTEWWYGAGFSNRPLIITYPILALSIGFLWLEIKNKIIKIGLLVFVMLCVFLNQFQWWQLKNYILDPYRTNKEYYWSIFLKTNVKESDKKLKEVYRDFGGTYEFKEIENYNITQTYFYDFENELKPQVVLDSNQNHLWKMTSKDEYSYVFEKPYKEITKKDHFWVKVKVKIKSMNSNEFPLLVVCIQRKEGAYGYYTIPLETKRKGEWETFTMEYQTPNIRNGNDLFKTYIWNMHKLEFEVDDMEITVFEKK